MSATIRTVTMATFALTLTGVCKIEGLQEIDVDEPIESRAFVSPPSIPDSVLRNESDAQLEAVLQQQLAVLAAPQLGGRRPGTQGARWTEAHLITTFQELGLVPDGTNRGWTQSLALRTNELVRASVYIGEAASPPTDTGTTGTEPTAGAEPSKGQRPGREVLRATQLAVRRDAAPGVWHRRVELVPVGHGISLPRAGHDDYERRQVAGKVVLVRDGWPDDLAEDQHSEIDALEHQLEQALAHGAIACIVLLDIDEKHPEWASRRRAFSASTIKIDDAARSAHSNLEFAALAVGPAARRLVELAQTARHEQPSRASLANGGKIPTQARPARGPDGAPSEPASLDIEIETAVRELDDHNIVGRIVGSQFPQQVVLVTAHWDAGGLEPVLAEGGGVHDNATGIAVLAAIGARSKRFTDNARAPRRSIVLAATAAGSLARAGSIAYLDSGLVQRNDLVGVVNLDTFRVGPTRDPLVIVDGARSTIRPLLSPRLDSFTVVDPTVRYDHEIFLDAGIPAISLTRGPYLGSDDPSPETWRGDKLQALLNDAALAFDVVWNLADREDTPRVLSTADSTDERTSAVRPANKAEPQADTPPTAAAPNDADREATRPAPHSPTPVDPTTSPAMSGGPTLDDTPHPTTAPKPRAAPTPTEPRPNVPSATPVD